MRQVTTADFMEGMVDEDGDPLSLNRVEDALRSAGIELRDQTTGVFRDLNEVLIELGNTWGTLDANTKAYLATTISGQRQQSRFVAAMDNWDDVMKNYATSQNSAGASAEQYMKKLQSLDSQLQRVAATVEESFSNMISPKFLNQIVGALTRALGLLNDIDALVSNLPLVGAGWVSWVAVLVAGFGALQFAVSRLDVKKAKQLANLLDQKDSRLVGETDPERIYSIRQENLQKGKQLVQLDNNAKLKEKEEIQRRIVEGKRKELMSLMDISSEEELNQRVRGLNQTWLHRKLREGGDLALKHNAISKEELSLQKIKLHNLTTKIRLLKQEYAIKKGILAVDESGNIVPGEGYEKGPKKITGGMQGFFGGTASGLLQMFKGNLLKVKGGLTAVGAGFAKLALGVGSFLTAAAIAIKPLLLMLAVFKAGMTVIEFAKGSRTADRNRREFEEASERLRQTEEYSNSLQDLSKRYEELTLKEKMNTDQKRELQKVQEEMIEIQKQLSDLGLGLIQMHDAEGSAILGNTLLLKEYNEELKKRLALERLEKYGAMASTTYSKAAEQSFIGSIGTLLNPFSTNRDAFKKDSTLEKEFYDSVNAMIRAEADVAGMDLNTIEGKVSFSILEEHVLEQIEKALDNPRLYSGDNLGLKNESLRGYTSWGAKLAQDFVDKAEFQEFEARKIQLDLEINEGKRTVSEIAEEWQNLASFLEESGVPEAAIQNIIGSSFSDYYKATLPQYSEYTDVLDMTLERQKRMRDNYGKISEAIAEINKGQELNLDLVQELVANNEELADYLLETGDFRFAEAEELERILTLQRERNRLEAEKGLIVSKNRRDVAQQDLAQATNIVDRLERKGEENLTDEELQTLREYRGITEILPNQIAAEERNIQNQELVLILMERAIATNKDLIDIQASRFESEKNSYETLLDIQESLQENAVVTPEIAEKIMNDMPELLMYLSDAELLLQKINEKQQGYLDNVQEQYQELYRLRMYINEQFYEKHSEQVKAHMIETLVVENKLSEDKAKILAEELKDYKTFNEAKLGIAKFYNQEILRDSAKLRLEQAGGDARVAVNQAENQLRTQGMYMSAEERADLYGQIDDLKSYNSAQDLFEKQVESLLTFPTLDFSKTTGGRDNENVIRGYELLLSKIDSEIELLQKKRELIEEGSKEYQDSLHQENNLLRQRARLMQEESARLKASYSGNRQLLQAMNEVDRFISEGGNIASMGDVKYFGDAADLSQEQLSDLQDYISLKSEAFELDRNIQQNSIQWFQTVVEANEAENELLTAKMDLLSLTGERYSYNQEIVKKTMEERRRLYNTERSLLAENAKIIEGMLANKSLVMTPAERRQFEKDLIEINSQLMDTSTIVGMINQEVGLLLTNVKRTEQALGTTFGVLQSLDTSMATPNILRNLSQQLDNKQMEMELLKTEIEKVSLLMGAGTAEEQLENFLRFETLVSEYSGSMVELMGVYQNIDSARTQAVARYLQDLEYVNSSSQNMISLYKALEGFYSDGQIGLRLHGVNEQFKEQEKIVKANIKAFDELAKIVPQSENEKRNLEKTLVDLNQEIVNGQIALMDYKKEFQNIKMTQIADEMQTVLTILENKNTILGNNIELMSKGYRSVSDLMLDFSILGMPLSEQAMMNDELIRMENNRAKEIQRIREMSAENHAETELQKYQLLLELSNQHLTKNMQEQIKAMDMTEDITTDLLNQIANATLEANEMVSGEIVNIWQTMLDQLRLISDEALNLAEQMGVEVERGVQKTMTTVWDDKGGKHLGYLEDGKTYLADGTRLPEGYYSLAGGKVYKMTPEGGVLVDGPPQRHKNEISPIELGELKPGQMTSDGLDLSNVKMYENLKLFDKMDKEAARKLKEFEARRQHTDKLIANAQRSIIEANKLGLDSTKETDRLLNFIENKIAEDTTFMLDIQKEIIGNQLAVLEEAERLQRQAFLDALASGSATEEMRIQYMDTVIRKQEAQLALQQAIEESMKIKIELHEKMQDRHQHRISVLEAELEIVKLLYGEEGDKAIEQNKKILEQLNTKMRNQQNFLQSLQDEIALTEVGSAEWYILNDAIKEAELSLLNYKSEMIKMAQDIQRAEIENQLRTFEKGILGGKTLEEIRKERDRYLTGRERELVVDNLINQMNRDNLSLTTTQMQMLEGREKLKRSEVELIQRELDLQRQQMRLDEIRANKSIQTLERDAFGNWSFNYTADQRAIEEAEQALRQAEVDFERFAEDVALENIENYLDDIREIMEKTFSGEYSSLNQIGDSLLSIDNSLKGGLSESVLIELADYMNSINQIIENQGGFNLPSFKTSDFTGSNIENLTQITINTVEFPNATDKDDIIDVFMNLEQAVKQKNKGF